MAAITDRDIFYQNNHNQLLTRVTIIILIQVNVLVIINVVQLYKLCLVDNKLK